jgi:hypothetical protein
MSADVSQGDWTVLALGGFARGGSSVPGDAATGLGRRRDEVVGIVAGLVGARLQLLALHLLGDAVSIINTILQVVAVVQRHVQLKAHQNNGKEN